MTFMNDMCKYEFNNILIPDSLNMISNFILEERYAL